MNVEYVAVLNFHTKYNAAYFHSNRITTKLKFTTEYRSIEEMGATKKNVAVAAKAKPKAKPTPRPIVNKITNNITNNVLINCNQPARARRENVQTTSTMTSDVTTHLNGTLISRERRESTLHPNGLRRTSTLTYERGNPKTLGN